jgi:hypothetical protein
MAAWPGPGLLHACMWRSEMLYSRKLCRYEWDAAFAAHRNEGTVVCQRNMASRFLRELQSSELFLRGAGGAAFLLYEAKTWRPVHMLSWTLVILLGK